MPQHTPSRGRSYESHRRARMEFNRALRYMRMGVWVSAVQAALNRAIEYARRPPASPGIEARALALLLEIQFQGKGDV